MVSSVNLTFIPFTIYTTASFSSLLITFSFLRWTTEISDNNQSCTPYVTFIKNSEKVSRIILLEWKKKKIKFLSFVFTNKKKSSCLKAFSIVGKMRRFFITLMTFMRRNVVTKLLLLTENFWLNFLLRCFWGLRFKFRSWTFFGHDIVTLIHQEKLFIYL